MQNVSNQAMNMVNTQYATPVTQQTVAQPYYPQVQQQPSPLQSSGVNIVIYNPSVNPSAGTVANSNNSYGMLPQAYPPNYYLQQPQYVQPEPIAQQSIANTAIKDDSKVSEEIPVATKPQEPEKEETHKKDIVQLTDDYVRTLENYLNNSNVKIREMGVKELMARFQEHKSRANDVALTNLLNKALQDGSKAVRFVALATLDAGYAEGDALTKEILQKMQSSKDVFGEDALMASEILLKTAGNKVEVEVPGPAPDKKDSVKNNMEKK
ncbi:hypothetical protein IJE86_01115 [bacterium]|nr:hypothetical protein [bacterium]